MNIPNYPLFNLGFGFKYQYLMSALIYTLITKKVNLKKTKKYISKKIINNPIHANIDIFIKQVNSIFKDYQNLNYNKNALLMLEGEHDFFEDINLFISNNRSKIIFFQVKGSMDSSNGTLNRAVIKTIFNMINNKNIKIPFKLIILINNDVTNYIYGKTAKDKLQIIISVLRKFEFMIEIKKKQNRDYNNFLNILNEYVENLLDIKSNKPKNIYNFFYLEDKIIFNKYKKILFKNEMHLIIKKLTHILDNTSIVKNLDYRLLYLFLKFQYGNDSLNKLLWNIEIKSMDGTNVYVNELKNTLKKINFNRNCLNKLYFNKTNHKVKVGKIL